MSQEIDIDPNIIRRVVKIFLLVVGACVLLGMLAGGCGRTTVNPGTVGVEVRFGKTLGIRWPGMYLTVFSNITPMNTRTQTYTMAGAGTEAAVNGSVNVLSKDQLPVTLDVSVMFHLNDQFAGDVFRNFGPSYDDTIVHPQVRTNVRDAASEFNALDLIDKRGDLQARMNVIVRERLAETLAGRGVNRHAVVIESIMIRNIDLPNSLDASIAAVQQQRMAAQTATQANETARQEAARLLTETNGQTAAQVARATAAARVTQINADALALANRTIADSLTPAYLAYARIQATQAVLGSSQTRTVFMPPVTSGGNTPNLLLNLPQ